MTKNVIEENKSSVYLLNIKSMQKQGKLQSAKRDHYFCTEIYFILDAIWGASSLQSVLHVAWAACASATADPFLRI